MKKSTITSKFIAVLLLLVFTQKMGASLYLHNWFHGKAAAQPLSTTQDDKNIACSCIDDFAVPFTDTSSSIQIETVTTFVVLPVFYEPTIATVHKLYNSLRAPPSATC